MKHYICWISRVEQLQLWQSRHFGKVNALLAVLNGLAWNHFPGLLFQKRFSSLRLQSMTVSVLNWCADSWHLNRKAELQNSFFLYICFSIWKLCKTHKVGKSGKLIFMAWINPTYTACRRMSFRCLQLRIQFSLHANCICLIAFSICEWFVW